MRWRVGTTVRSAGPRCRRATERPFAPDGNAGTCKLHLAHRGPATAQRGRRASTCATASVCARRRATRSRRVRPPTASRCSPTVKASAAGDAGHRRVLWMVCPSHTERWRVPRVLRAYPLQEGRSLAPTVRQDSRPDDQPDARRQSRGGLGADVRPSPGRRTVSTPPPLARASTRVAALDVRPPHATVRCDRSGRPRFGDDLERVRTGADRRAGPATAKAQPYGSRWLSDLRATLTSLVQQRTATAGPDAIALGPVSLWLPAGSMRPVRPGQRIISLPGRWLGCLGPLVATTLR